MPDGDTHCFYGIVGNRNSSFALIWQSYGNAEGHYQELAYSGIISSGETRNTNGRVWKVSFSRRPPNDQEIDDCSCLQERGAANRGACELFHV